ncbi:MAG TPA: carbohydrate kinase family protein [archaeon]|nr:carbohydrate kinase family protein [archaeon]
MPYDVISIGSCTLDCIIRIDDILRFELLNRDIVKKYTAIEYSRKLNINNVNFIPGGSGANIASDCAMLGLNTAYIGVIGKDFSAGGILEDMKNRGVNLSNIIQTDEDVTAFSLILRTDWGKDRSILAYKGANNLLKPEHVKEEIFENAKTFAWTSLTSDSACQAIEKAINITKNNGGIVFAAPSMSIIKNAPKWAKLLLSKSDIISINYEEAQEFTGENKKTLMLNIFLDMGARLISITDGANGSIISDGETIINSGTFSNPDFPVQDTTGAGDAFLSGLLISTLNNFDIKKASKIASAMASLECREVGVREGLPHSLSELDNFIDTNEINQVISKII